MGLFSFIFKFLFFTLDLFDITKSGGYSRRSLLGTIKHYDKNGHQVGYSLKGWLGDTHRYDMKGNLVSTTRKGAFGEYKTYDTKGELVRTFRRNVFGGYTTYDRQGKQVGDSYRNSLREMCHEGTDEYVYDTPMIGIPERNAVVETKKNSPGVSKKRKFSHKTPSIKELRDDLDADSVEQYTNDNTNDSISDIKENPAENVEFCKSVVDYVKDKNINKYAKILVFEYKDMKEFPAIAHIEQDNVKVLPLINDSSSFIIKKREIHNAKRVCVEGIDMFVVDDEFYNLGITELGAEFEELLPEYLFDRAGMKRIQYVINKDLIITEKSMNELTKIL